MVNIVDSSSMQVSQLTFSRRSETRVGCYLLLSYTACDNSQWPQVCCDKGETP